jgi:hypothetical protein
LYLFFWLLIFGPIFNWFCSVYGKDQKLDRAVEMLNKARTSDAPLDERAYMNLIGYYGKAGTGLVYLN